MTVIPGMDAAARRNRVSSHSAAAPGGLTNSTYAFTRPWACAITSSNSATLALVHGQCGCANITRVGFSAGRGKTDSTGQLDRVLPTVPAVVSYLNRTRAPNARAVSQVMLSKLV